MKNIILPLGLFAALGVSACGTATVNTNVKATADAIPSNTAAASTAAATPVASATPAAVDNSSPKAVVADLYKQHDAQKGPFFQTGDRAAIDRYFTKPLADLIWKDATTAGDEVGAIDGDPLYDAQDMEIKEFSIGEEKIAGDSATVPVTFKNFDKKYTINYALKKEGDAWKIDNILYASRPGDSLMKWLKETYPEGKKK